MNKDPQHPNPKKIVSIVERLPSNANVQLRQQAVRNVMRESAEFADDIAPVAMISITVGPQGEIRTLATLVEAEYVPPMVVAMEELAADLLAFARSRRALVS